MPPLVRLWLASVGQSISHGQLDSSDGGSCSLNGRLCRGRTIDGHFYSPLHGRPPPISCTVLPSHQEATSPLPEVRSPLLAVYKSGDPWISGTHPSPPSSQTVAHCTFVQTLLAASENEQPIMKMYYSPLKPSCTAAFCSVTEL